MKHNPPVQIPSPVRHQVRNRMQMILSAMELDRPQEFIQHITELVNIAKSYLADKEARKPK